jgi:hypothetical protein
VIDRGRGLWRSSDWTSYVFARGAEFVAGAGGGSGGGGGARGRGGAGDGGAAEATSDGRGASTMGGPTSSSRYAGVC